jgi:hypothetical protein
MAARGSRPKIRRDGLLSITACSTATASLTNAAAFLSPAAAVSPNPALVLRGASSLLCAPPSRKQTAAVRVGQASGEAILLGLGRSGHDTSGATSIPGVLDPGRDVIEGRKC